MFLNLISKKKDVKQEDGSIKHYTNFYLVLETGAYIPIKPAFKQDYKSLVVLADKKDN